MPSKILLVSQCGFPGKLHQGLAAPRVDEKQQGMSCYKKTQKNYKKGTENMKRKHASFAESTFILLNCFMNLVIKVFLKCVIHFFGFCFRW